MKLRDIYVSPLSSKYKYEFNRIIIEFLIVSSKLNLKITACSDQGN